MEADSSGGGANHNTTTNGIKSGIGTGTGTAPPQTDRSLSSIQPTLKNSEQDQPQKSNHNNNNNNVGSSSNVNSANSKASGISYPAGVNTSRRGTLDLAALLGRKAKAEERTEEEEKFLELKRVFGNRSLFLLRFEHPVRQFFIKVKLNIEILNISLLYPFNSNYFFFN